MSSLDKRIERAEAVRVKRWRKAHRAFMVYERLKKAWMAAERRKAGLVIDRDHPNLKPL